MLYNETEKKVNETISNLCDDIQTCVNMGIKKGVHSVGVNNLPELLNSLANVVSSVKD